MSASRRITSRDNALYRELVELGHSARERRRQGRSFLEGVHLCEAYLQRHGPPALAAASESALRDPEVHALVARHRLEPAVLADELFRAISTVENGIGLVFVVATPRPPVPAAIERDAVYLDRVQDPGNVGTILRTCAAAGIDTVIASPGTAFCWSPKVLRAAVGAHFHLSIHESVPWAVVAPRVRVEAAGTRATGGESLFTADLSRPRLWLFGNEGEGLSDEVAAAARRWISIPQRPGVESLNVAAAVAVCLFEQARQRAAAGQAGRG